MRSSSMLFVLCNEESADVLSVVPMADRSLALPGKSLGVEICNTEYLYVWLYTITGGFTLKISSL